MKIKKKLINKYKLFKLQLLKLKSYKFDNIKNEQLLLKLIELHLKKAFKIIYNYHVNKKIIFFIGLTQKAKKNYLKTLKKTQHLFVPKLKWVNGILLNKIPIFKYINKQINVNLKKKNKNLRSFFEIYQKPDLIVVFNQKLELNVVNEANKLKIPIVCITSSLKIDLSVLYKIPGNFDFSIKKFDSIIFLLLNCVLKRSFS